MGREAALIAALGLVVASSARGAPALAGELANAPCPPGMLFVPGGSFAMGDADGFRDEQPVRQTTVRAFCLDATEVTVAAYADCAGAGLCAPAHARPVYSTLKSREVKAWSDMCNRDRADRRDHPVNCVTFAEGERYCRAYGLRLPTEAEWEYAARGGAEARRFPWGDAAPTGRRANLCGAECAAVISAIRGIWSPLYPESDGFPATAPVGSFPEGMARWDHQDLTGNVCEWVTGKHCPYAEPDCPDEGTRLVRGNHFLANNLKKARAARRNGDDRWHRSPDVGFRCAAEVGLTERRPAALDPVTVYPELPSSPRVATAAALALLVGVALAGFGSAASAIVLAILLYVAELDPQTAISTAFLVVGAAHAAALNAPALRRRIAGDLAGPMARAAFAPAFGAAALAGFLPDRVRIAALAIAMVALAVHVAWQARRSAAGAPGASHAESPPTPPPLALGGACLGALSGVLGFPTSSLHGALLGRFTTLPAAEIAATAALPALLTALGGALGAALHARPDPGLGIVMGTAAAAGALLRGLAPPRAPSRVGQIALSLSLLALGLILFAREILPAAYFPDL